MFWAVLIAFFVLPSVAQGRELLPDGQIERVLRDNHDRLISSGEVWVEVGPGVVASQIVSRFTALYKDATGEDLTWEKLQAANRDLNLTLLCEQKSGRRQWIGTDETGWTSCPEADRNIAVIAGVQGRLKIPLASVKTFAERLKAGEAALACEQSVDCLKGKLAALGEDAKTDATDPPEGAAAHASAPQVRVADAEAVQQVVELKAQNAAFERDAIIRTKWMILFGLILSTALLLAGLWTFELKLVLREKDQGIADLNTAHSTSLQARQDRLDVAEGDLRESQGLVERVATKLGVPTQGQVVHDAVLRTVDVFASVMRCMREIADGYGLQLSQLPTAVELQAVSKAIDVQALDLEGLRDHALRTRRALGEDMLPSAQQKNMPTKQVGEDLLSIAQQRRRELAGLLGLTWSSEIPPAFKQITDELRERLELLRRLQQENGTLSTENAALLARRQACVDAETGILARLVNQVATMGEWLGVDPSLTRLADAPDRMRAANAAFGRIALSLDRLLDQLGVVRPVEWRDLSKRPPTIAARLALLETWLASEREAEERFRAGLTRLCAVDEEGIVLDRARLVNALQERIDLHDGNLNALALAERRLLARSIAGWSGESGTDPGSLQDLVRAAQSFARDARRFEGEIGRAIQGGATALHVDLDKAQPLQDRLKCVLTAAIAAAAPKSPATLAQEFMDACGHRVHNELTALKLLLGYDFGAENGAAPDSNKTGVQSLRDNPGVARTLVRWVMADFSGPNDSSISTAVAAQ